MIEGVVPFPPEFAEEYRRKGYWRDQSLAQLFSEGFRQYADRIALVDGDRSFSYAQLGALSENLALNLLDAGIRPRERVVVFLPNVAEFVILYFALQKIGSIPVAALVTHRYQEIRQFVELAGAVACIAPECHGDYQFAPLIERIRAESATLRTGIMLGRAPQGFLSLQALIETPATRAREELDRIEIDPVDPAVFLLSGGTTGIPKLIPRTHNDYAYNSRTAASVTEVGPDSILLLVLPIAHNLPLGCPGLQGFLMNGARVVLGASTRPRDVFELVQRHRVTHIHVVPALLIRWINDPALADYDLSSLRMIQSGGQRLQPEIRLKTKALIPNVFVQENFGMAEGTLMFVRVDDPEEVRLETVGSPMCPDDEIRLVDDEDRPVKPGEVGEMCCRGPYTLRGYFGVPEYNARAFTSDGFYRSGDLMRQHPSGNYMVEGRKKDLINRGGEKISAEEIENLILTHPAVRDAACVAIPDERLGERMCACVILKTGSRLDLEQLTGFLSEKEIAKHKLPERLEIMEAFPVSTFGKVSKKDLVELVSKMPAAG
ncbi:MAG: AMP-binding protein [bacterium]